MKIRINGESVEIDRVNPTINELLEKLGINPEEVVVALNKRITPEETTLQEGDEITTIKAVSGG